MRVPGQLPPSTARRNTIDMSSNFMSGFPPNPSQGLFPEQLGPGQYPSPTSAYNPPSISDSLKQVHLNQTGKRGFPMPPARRNTSNSKNKPQPAIPAKPRGIAMSGMNMHDTHALPPPPAAFAPPPLPPPLNNEGTHNQWDHSPSPRTNHFPTDYPPQQNYNDHVAFSFGGAPQHNPPVIPPVKKYEQTVLKQGLLTFV